MAKRIVKHGSTSRMEHVFLLDSASTTGAGKTGVAASAITAYYIRNGGTATSISLAGPGTIGTWSSTNNWTEVSSTNMPGLYEFDIPDAVFASGADHAVIMIKGTGIAPVVLEYDLVAYDSQDTVRLGLTSLPNAAAGASGGLIAAGTGAYQLSVAATGGYLGTDVIRSTTFQTNSITSDAMATDSITINELSNSACRDIANFVWNSNWLQSASGNAEIPTLGSNWGANSMGQRVLLNRTTDAANGLGDIADSVWDEAYSGHTTAGSFGKLMDILRKANLVTEGTVTSATANNTTMQFVSTTTDIANKADDHWRGQTLLFVSGNLVGQSTTVARFNTTTNTITLDSALTEAPALNDEFVMMPVHTHPVDEIGEAVLNARLGSLGQLGYVSATFNTSNTTIQGVNSFVEGDSVSFLGSAPSGFSLGTKYYVKASPTPTSFQLASGSSSGTAIQATSAVTTTLIPRDERTVKSAMQYLRNKIDIATGTLKVYAEDDVAESWSASTTTNSSALPIVTFDPTD